MKKNDLLVFLLTFCIVQLSAQIDASTAKWAPVGDVVITYKTNDLDNGDGAGDGAFFVDGKSSATGQGADCTLGGSMVQGQALNVSTFVYNENVSYVRFKVQLYNESDNTVLAESSSVVLGGDTMPVEVTLNYTPLASDDGDALKVRYLRDDDGNTARDFNIDNLKIGDDYARMTVASLGLDTPALVTITLSPNPTTRSVTISNPNNFQLSYKIFDLRGQRVLQGKTVKNIPLDGLPRALYFVRIKGKTFPTITKKVIKM